MIIVTCTLQDREGDGQGNTQKAPSAGCLNSCLVTLKNIDHYYCQHYYTLLAISQVKKKTKSPLLSKQDQETQ